MTSQNDKNEYRQVRDTIYTFFYYLNKPVGLAEIMLQFKNHKKATVQKVLDDLVAKNKIFMRLFGKSKIYCLTQDMSYSVDECYTEEIDREQNQEIEDKVLRFLKWNYERHSDELNTLRNESKELDSQLKEFECQLTVEELKRAIKDMKSVIEEDKGTEKEESVSFEEFNKKKKQLTAVKKESAKRTGIFKDIVDGICDGCGVKKKDLLRDAGIE